jgi:4-oxalocrotonate tautomerase
MPLLPDTDGDAQLALLKLAWQSMRRRLRGAPIAIVQTRSEDMPTIHVEMLAGRSQEQKRALVKGLTECFTSHCGGTPASVQVVISEFGKDQWAVGGELISDRKT